MFLQARLVQICPFSLPKRKRTKKKLASLRLDRSCECRACPRKAQGVLFLYQKEKERKRSWQACGLTARANA
ncbi:MAG: hypothetical protein IKD07_06685, partial [Clostridia bacterium]|nr:hypothetical protein [Clostridia bacterium]